MVAGVTQTPVVAAVGKLGDAADHAEAGGCSDLAGVDCGGEPDELIRRAVGLAGDELDLEGGPPCVGERDDRLDLQAVAVVQCRTRGSSGCASTRSSRTTSDSTSRATRVGPRATPSTRRTWFHRTGASCGSSSRRAGRLRGPVAGRCPVPGTCAGLISRGYQDDDLEVICAARVDQQRDQGRQRSVEDAVHHADPRCGVEQSTPRDRVSGTHRFAEVRQLMLEWLPHTEDVIINGADHSLALTHASHIAGHLATFIKRHPIQKQHVPKQ
ncbi:hypothetical protein BH23ACT6_BH23ACT6_27360 [soil metagenome]